MFKVIVISKNLLTFVALLITCCCLNSTVHSQSVVTQTGVTRVVVDAGHGGPEPGAVGKNSREKDLNLAVALLAGKMISDSFPSVQVIYTRKTDITVPLHERANIANKSNADLFISIHTNSVKNRAAKGSETFVMGTAKSAENMEVAKRENAVIIYEEDYTSKYEGYDPNSPESFIIFSLMQNTYLDQSLQMAALVQEEFGTSPITVNRGVKQAGFLVLYLTAMPSILIETGFISNPEDEKVLMSKEGQMKMAHSIFRAFKRYKAYYDRQAELAGNAVPTTKPASELTAKAAATVTPAPAKQPAATPEIKQTTAPEARQTTTPATPEIKQTAAPATTVVQERSLYTALEERPQAPPAATPATSATPEAKQTTTPATVSTGAAASLTAKPAAEQVRPAAAAKRSYRVQIMASRVKLPTTAKEFAAFQDVKVILADGWYKYTTGDFDTLAKAQRYCTEVVRKTVQGAFVVCVENEKFVPLR